MIDQAGVAPVPVMLMARALSAGGTERQLTEMARGLDCRRFSVHVGCFEMGIREKDLRAAGIPILKLGVNSFLRPGVLSGALQLRSYLRKNKIKLVHTFDYPLTIFGVPVARASGVPVVLSSQRAHRHLTPPRDLKLVRFSERLADGIVVNCRAVEMEMRQKEGVPEQKLRLCYNGIDTKRLNPGGRARLPELGSPSLLIGAVSVLRPEKGLGTLIGAFAKVFPQAPQMRLLIVGSGPELASLQRLAETLGVRHACIFQPAVQDVVPWFKSIDIFVLPSQSEALSNSLMEAMACGCACIASRVGGNPELVIERETGLLFEPGDATELSEKLRDLIQDRDLRASVAGRAAETIATKFSLGVAATRMQGIYESYLIKKRIPLADDILDESK